MRIEFPSKTYLDIVEEEQEKRRETQIQSKKKEKQNVNNQVSRTYKMVEFRQ